MPRQQTSLNEAALLAMIKGLPQAAQAIAMNTLANGLDHGDTTQIHPGEEHARRSRIGIAGWALLLFAQILFFQAYPKGWGYTYSGLRWLGQLLVRLIAIFDVRNWNFVGYAIALSATLAVLIVLKVWGDRAASEAELRRWKRDHPGRS
jgi:hypothetical protein